jgi:hypothetical protein
VAVWQIPIGLVPAKWAEKNEYSTDTLYDEDGYQNTSRAWEEYQPTLNLDELFSNMLAKANSWDEDLTVWGNDEKHDISIWREEGAITSICFRLDLREPITKLLMALVEAANKLNCLLFIGGQKVMIKPNIFELKKYILKSNARSFVSDPESFLKDLDHE